MESRVSPSSSPPQEKADSYAMPEAELLSRSTGIDELGDDKNSDPVLRAPSESCQTVSDILPEMVPLPPSPRSQTGHDEKCDKIESRSDSRSPTRLSPAAFDILTDNMAPSPSSPCRNQSRDSEKLSVGSTGSPASLAPSRTVQDVLPEVVPLPPSPATSSTSSQQGVDVSDAISPAPRRRVKRFFALLMKKMFSCVRGCE